MKKILYIGGFELPDKNAAAQRVLSNAKALRELGYEISFIGISHSLINNQFECGEIDGFKYKLICYPKNIFQWFKYLVEFIQSKEILIEKPSHVFLYHLPALATQRIISFCKKNGIKVINDITEWYTPEKWNFHDFLLRIDVWFRMYIVYPKSDGIIAISKFLFDFFKDKCYSILVPPLVDLSSDKWNNSLQKPNRNISLVYAGKPCPSKDRLDIIIESLRRHPNIIFNIIGITKEQYCLIFNLKKFNKPNNVNFLGYLPHKDTVNRIKSADFQIFIRTHNRVNTAGFPTKFVESIACGIPVITNATSDIADYLRNEINGFLITENNSLDSVFTHISTMDNSIIQNMKTCCKKTKSFDYHSYVAIFNQLLEIV